MAERSRGFDDAAIHRVACSAIENRNERHSVAKARNNTSGSNH